MGCDWVPYRPRILVIGPPIHSLFHPVDPLKRVPVFKNGNTLLHVDDTKPNPVSNQYPTGFQDFY